MSTTNFGTNKATDRKSIKDLLVNLTLSGFVAALADVGPGNKDIKKGVQALGFTAFAETTIEVLKTQTSGSRGRPALEEQPIHTIIAGLKAAISTFESAKEDVKVEKTNKVLAKALKKCEAEQANLLQRRSMFKPSKRVQGSKLMALHPVAKEA